MSKKKLSVLFLVVALILLLVIPASADGPDPSAADTTANETVGAAAVASPLSTSSPSGSVLYDNGPLVNCVGCGVGGADESALQDISLGMSVVGFGHQSSAGNRMADDFTIPAGDGWDITGFVFFAYQSFEGTTSTITAVNYQIWDGEPGNGGTVIYGDNATNQMVATDWTNIYRVTESTTGGNTDRAIMWDETGAGLAEGGSLHLDPGTYWVDWQSDGSGASGPWAPPITINGVCVTGNSLQSITDDGATWGPALDTGSGCAQGMPFLVLGTESGGGDPSPAGKTYEVYTTLEGPADCWTFNEDGSFWSDAQGQLGRWVLKNQNSAKARWIAQVGGSSGWRVGGVTNVAGNLKASGLITMASYSGTENPSCGAP
jgi:hypothetical protein